MKYAPKAPFSRAANLVLLGGLTAGVGFGTLTGIASAATTPSSSSASNSSHRAGSSAPMPPPGPPGGPMAGPGRVPGGGPGGPPGGPGSGTITAINGSTLTLRTLNGTETVETSSSTTYYKEMQAISFSDLRIGEVVQVMGRPASAGSSKSTSSPPPQPGTGTVEAKQVSVVEPTFYGRVQSKSSNGTLTIVGADGQLLTVDTTGSTRYYKGTTKTTSSAVTDGTRIVAEGRQTSLSALDANVIDIAPVPPTPGKPPSPPRAVSDSSLAT